MEKKGLTTSMDKRGEKVFNYGLPLSKLNTRLAIIDSLSRVNNAL
jgi:hypothetical protein